MPNITNITNITRFKSKLKVKEVNEYEDITDVGIDAELFKAGYEHGLVSNVLNNFKKSFMHGFRKAKLEQLEEAYKNVKPIR